MKTFAFQISQSENNVLLILVLLICFVYFLNLENKATQSYNNSVKEEQAEKLRLANDPDKSKISFRVYSFERTPFWFLLYALQFFTNPLSYFLLKGKSFGNFLLSLIFTTTTFYCFSMWIYDTITYFKFEDYEIFKDTPFNEFILYQSTKLEFTLFLLIFFLFVFQIFILLRFAAEKFQAKISLR